MDQYQNKNNTSKHIIHAEQLHIGLAVNDNYVINTDYAHATPANAVGLIDYLLYGVHLQ